MIDPELSASCEAAGLELVVRAWWRGGAGKSCGPKEAAWLKKTVAGGVVGGAHSRLLRCGIPERVLQSGVQLGQVLAKDSGVNKNWQHVAKQRSLEPPKSARSTSKRLFQEKLIEEVKDHFDIRMPSIPGVGMQLTPRKKTAERSPRQREDDERMGKTDARPGSSPVKVQRAWQDDRGLVRQDSKGQPVRRLPTFESRESSKEASLELPRGMKVRPKLDPETLQSRKEMAQRWAEGDPDRGFYHRAAKDSSPASPMSPLPKARNFADIFQSTASKMIDREGQWAVQDGSPTSPVSSWNGWDFKGRSAGTPKRGVSSRFDEWAKKQEEKKVEEAKEEDVSRKQKLRESVQEGDNLHASLLNDKAVAATTVTKKAVTDLNSIRRIFMEFDSDGSGMIEPPEFMPLLSRLLRRHPQDLDKKEVWAVWDQVDSDGSGTIDFDEFQRWYAELMGIDILDYGMNFVPDDISSDQIMVRTVAKNLNRSILEVEKIFDEFKKLDTDNSNTLEMNEFRQLIQKEFAPKGPEVPEHVFKMFWKDFDKDGRGSVTFVDFCKWYLKFMKGEASPMEQYFAYVSATPGATLGTR